MTLLKTALLTCRLQLLRADGQDSGVTDSIYGLIFSGYPLNPFDSLKKNRHMGKQDNQSDVQLRLMEMLDSVSLDSHAPARSTAAGRGEPVQKTTSPSSATPPARSITASKAPAVANGTHCTHCDATTSWEGASWCPKCGFYPKLGRTVFDEHTRFDNDDDEEEAPLTILGLVTQIPLWVYILLIGCFGLLVGGVAIRVMVPDVYYRGIIGLYLLVFGAIVFGLSHLRAYFISAEGTDKITFGAMFVSPVRIWSEAFKKIAVAQKVFISGAWGFSIVLLSVIVVGLDWNGLFNPEQYANKPKFNPLKFLMKSAMSMANLQQQSGVPTGGGLGTSGGTDDFDSALGDFADVAGVENLTGAAGGGGGSSDGSGLESAMGDFAGASGVDTLTGSGNPSSETGVGGLNDISSSVGEITSNNGDPKLLGSGGESTSPGFGISQNGTGAGNAPATTSASGVSNVSQTAKETKTSLLQFPQAVKKVTAIDPLRPDQGEYVVIGYTTNAGGEIRSLLLAETKNGRPVRFKTRFQLTDTDAATIQRLEKTFEDHRSRRPAIASPYTAKWVQPVVMCQIAYNGLTTSGALNNGIVLDYYLLSTASANSMNSSTR